jgi:hypothetical protein
MNDEITTVILLPPDGPPDSMHFEHFGGESPLAALGLWPKQQPKHQCMRNE